MINKISVIKYIIVFLVCCANIINAQTWNTYPSSSGNNFNQLDENNAIESVGIGDFNGNGIFPSSALHIGTNFMGYLPNNTLFSLGEVFRTTCPADISTYWRMERITGDNPVEYGMLYTLGAAEEVEIFPNASSDFGIHFYMQSSFAGLWQ